MNDNRLIDHTLLKANASKQDIKTLCQEAMEYHFASVCVNPTHVQMAHEILKDSDTAVCTVIGFPLGASTSKSKFFETCDAIENGADEIDMVINIGALIEGDDELVKKDIEAVVKGAQGRIVKVIIETCLLNDEQKVRACLLAKDAHANFVKTSTGFSTGGATVEDVRLMKQTVGKDMFVKAAGGIRHYEDMVKIVEAGASRIGTSAGIQLMKKK